jgi:hypothetical protein
MTDENGGNGGAHCGFLGITLRTHAVVTVATCGTHPCWTIFRGSNTMPLNAQQRFAMHVGLKQTLGDEVADMLIDQLSSGDVERLEQKMAVMDSRLSGIDTRLDKLEKKVDTHFRWMLGLWGTTMLTIVVTSVQLNLAIASIGR